MNIKKYKPLITTLLAISMVTVIGKSEYGFIKAGNDLTDATVKSYEDQLAEFQRKQEQALSELDDIRSSKSDAWVEIGKYDELLRYGNDKLNLMTKHLDSLKEQIEIKKQLITETENGLAWQENAFLERMASVYMEENMSFIEMLFDADNLVDFMSKMDYINAIFDYDEYIIKELTENLKTLEIDKAALLVAEENQQKSVAELEVINKQNQELHDSKLEYINSLVSDENSLVEEYSYYKQLEDEINYELESYLEELAARQARQNTVYVGGSIWWPLDNSVRYYVSSEYGWRNLYGMQDFHLGIDLACASGTTVLAANSGTVLRSEYHWSYGNYVLIDHGGGISTLYAHMSSAAVSQGDRVEAGQTIGWVGLTGNTFGYHLHFETRENGSTVNPRNYLAFP